MFPRWRCTSGSGNSAFSALMNSAGCGRGVVWPRPTHQDDAGGQRVRAVPVHRLSPFGAHRPRPTDRESGLNHGSGMSPIRCSRCRHLLALRLLECVIDCYGKAGAPARQAAASPAVMPSRKNASAFPCCRAGTGWLQVPRPWVRRRLRIGPGRRLAASDAARRRRSPTGRRSRCCRSTAGRC